MRDQVSGVARSSKSQQLSSFAAGAILQSEQDPFHHARQALLENLTKQRYKVPPWITWKATSAPKSCGKGLGSLDFI